MDHETRSLGPSDRAAALRLAAEQKGLTLPTTGTSMLPNIHAGDAVAISAGTSRYRFGDVAAFVAADGAIVIHRYVGRRRVGSVFLGDNEPRFDPPVPDRRLIGRADAPRRVLSHAINVLQAAGRGALGRVPRWIGRA